VRSISCSSEQQQQQQQQQTAAAAAPFPPCRFSWTPKVGSPRKKWAVVIMTMVSLLLPNRWDGVQVSGMGLCPGDFSFNFFPSCPPEFDPSDFENANLSL